MAKEFSKAFYHSKAWKDTRDAYAKERGYLCEMCLAEGKYNVGVIVHHITELTPYNIEIPEVTLGHDNLMLLCRDCHAKVHKTQPKRYKVAPDGQIITV